MKQKLLQKTLLLLFALIAGSTSVWAADVNIATATFNGKNETYTDGWTTTGTGKNRTDCIIIGKNENITSPAFNLTGYSKVTITFSARRYGTLSNSKATVDASIGGVSQGTLDITNGSVGAVSGNINFVPTSSMTAAVLVFTCTNATSPGSTHGAGIGTITITGTTADARTETITTIDASGITNTDLASGTEAGKLTASVTAGGSPVGSASVTWTSSDPTVATIDAGGNVTLVKNGTTTITASYAGDEDYQPSSSTYGLTVTNSAILSINLNNTLFGIDTGNNGTEQSTTVSGVRITTGCESSASNKTYYASDHIRFYQDSYLILEAPTGYVITGISLNRKGTDTWNGNKVTPSTGSFAASEAGTAPLVWSGFASEVEFDYSGQCRTASVDVVLTEIVTIAPTKDYTTYVTTKAMDFTGVADLKAYVATAANATSVTLEEPTAAVPAGTPLVLKKVSGTSFDVPVVASASAPATNLLVAGDGTTPVGGDGVWDYILSGGLFYHVSPAGPVAVGKAYLHLDSAPGARELTINFDDETAINALENSNKVNDGAIYDLSGRRVENPTKGIYIMNGKKVVIK